MVTGNRGTRPSSEFDARAVFEACVEHDVAVEINSRPERRDPPTKLLELARDIGCRFSIDSDSHAPGQLDFLDYGCERAEAAGIDPDRIVNTWPRERLLAWAAKRQPLSVTGMLRPDAPVERAPTWRYAGRSGAGARSRPTARATASSSSSRPASAAARRPSGSRRWWRGSRRQRPDGVPSDDELLRARARAQPHLARAGEPRRPSVRWVDNQRYPLGLVHARRPLHPALPTAAGHARLGDRLRARPRALPPASSPVTTTAFWKLGRALPRGRAGEGLARRLLDGGSAGAHARLTRARQPLA